MQTSRIFSIKISSFIPVLKNKLTSTSILSSLLEGGLRWILVQHNSKPALWQPCRRGISVVNSGCDKATIITYVQPAWPSTSIHALGTRVPDPWARWLGMVCKIWIPASILAIATVQAVLKTLHLLAGRAVGQRFKREQRWHGTSKPSSQQRECWKRNAALANKTHLLSYQIVTLQISTISRQFEPEKLDVINSQGLASSKASVTREIMQPSGWLNFATVCMILEKSQSITETSG